MFCSDLEPIRHSPVHDSIAIRIILNHDSYRNIEYVTNIATEKMALYNSNIV